jgi:hypothetical protein
MNRQFAIEADTGPYGLANPSSVAYPAVVAMVRMVGLTHPIEKVFLNGDVL